MLIYCATNLINGKKYVGCTTLSLNERANRHIYEATKLGSNFKIHRAIREFSKENFKWEILEDGIINDEVLEKRECYWIRELNTFGLNGYNSTLGGEGTSGTIRSEEVRNKISEKKKGVPSLFKGKKHSEESKRNMSIGQQERFKKGVIIWNKGIHCSEETKRKIRETEKGHIPWNKGIPCSEETKAKLREAFSGEKGYWFGKVGPNKGKPAWNKGQSYSEEQKQKLRIPHYSTRGTIRPESVRLKISAAHKGKIFSKEHRENIRLSWIIRREKIKKNI